MPDRAEISAGVESRAPGAKAALAANGAAMQKVIDALRANGGKDVTTQTVSLSTAFDANGQPNGFVASNVASAETSLGGAGALIDAAVARRREHGLRPVALALGRRRPLPAGAREGGRGREGARRDPREGRRALARPRHGDVRVGRPPRRPFYAKASAAQDSTPVVSGPQETTASVSVTYELR